MSIKLTKSTIDCNDLIDLEETLERTEEILKKYALKHKDFSAVIEKDTEGNKLIVKTTSLEEHAN